MVKIMVLMSLAIFSEKHRRYPPFAPSFGKEKAVMQSIVRDILEKADRPMTVIDPGCGIGTLLVKLARQFPRHNFVGIEWGFWVFAALRLRSWRLKNLRVVRNNMFDVDFKDADVIMCFLMTPLMAPLADKILQECKKGVIVVSNTYTLPKLKLEETFKTRKKLFIQNVYMYKV